MAAQKGWNVRKGWEESSQIEGCTFRLGLEFGGLQGGTDYGGMNHIRTLKNMDMLTYLLDEQIQRKAKTLAQDQNRHLDQSPHPIRLLSQPSLQPNPNHTCRLPLVRLTVAME